MPDRVGQVHYGGTVNRFALNLLRHALLAGGVQALTSLTLLAPAVAKETPEKSAVSSEPGVMVRPFTGARSQKIHEETVKALEQAGVRLVPAGFEGEVALEDAPEPYIDVARQHQIKAFVHGNVTMSKRGWVLHMSVRNAKDGKVTDEPKLRAAWLPGLLKKIDTNLSDALQGPLSKTEAPEPATEAEPVSEAPEMDAADAAEPTKEENGGRPSALDISLGVGLMYREATYSEAVVDSQGHALQPASVGPLTLRAAGHWYPVAHFSDGFASHIGVSLSFYQSFGGATDMTNQSGQLQQYNTVFSELNAGLRGRIPFDAAELGLNAGFGQAELTIEGDNEVPAGPNAVPNMGVVPDADYSYFRFGPDIAIPLGAFDLEFGAFYRSVTLGADPGQWKEPRWFPNATADALELSLAGLIPLTESFSILISTEYRQYGLAMNTQLNALTVVPGTGMTAPNQSVAGGATDRYIGGFAGIQFTLPGSGDQAQN